MSLPPAKRRMTTRSTVSGPSNTPPLPPTMASSSTSRHQPIQIDSDGDMGVDSDEEEAFEYESDVASPEAQEDSDNEREEDGEDEIVLDDDDEEDQVINKKKDTEVIIISDEDEEEGSTPVPPPDGFGTIRPKGKLSSRKQYMADVDLLVQQYSSTTSNGAQVYHFEKQSDETVSFSLVHPAFKRGLKLIIMTPELAGYPTSHQNSICYSESEIGPDIESVMAEITRLPEHADRSLQGLLHYLIARIILHEPSPYVLHQQKQEDTEEDEDGSDAYEDDDALYGLSNAAHTGHTRAFLAALKSDFEDCLAAGFRPGFTHVSELDNIVSVSKKISELSIPPTALAAWDSSLITGSIKYLVLLLNFGGKYPIDPDNGTRGEVKFKVGISDKYKPSREAVMGAFRMHGGSGYTKNEFDPISLSAPLDSLFLNKFQEILLVRRMNPGLGWAGAELHCLTPGRDLAEVDKKTVRKEDKEEAEAVAGGSYKLPKDPMAIEASTRLANNYPLLAFSYLVRRFVMCPRFCLICFKKTTTDIVSLKPFVCDSPLCLFQLISLGLGPSLEHEIKTNAHAVDLLIQLAYTAAKENHLKDTMQPVGLSLEVPKNTIVPWKKGDPTVDYDSLDIAARNVGMAALISELPGVPDMKNWLEGAHLNELDKQLSKNTKLIDMKDGGVSGSAWKLLRWIVASNTSYLKLIEEEDELVQGVGKSYRQFRLVVGSPAKEHLLKEAIVAAKARSNNAKKFPSLFAFHGSKVGNWHNILREGLHFRDTVNGRAYGHGVYFAKQGELSLGTYSQMSGTIWKNADYGIGKLAAICEIVNMPNEFVSHNPYFVVDKVDWIQCRYLLVQRGNSLAPQSSDQASDELTTPRGLTRPVPLDPAHPITLSTKLIGIPDLTPKLDALANHMETEETMNDSDEELLKEPSALAPTSSFVDTSSTSQRASGGGGGKVSKLKRALGMGSSSAKLDSGKGKEKSKEKEKEKIPFTPCGEEILRLVRILPPPKSPAAGALRQIQIEMRSLIKEQEKDGPVECGFYFDFERSDGNLFNWIIEIPRESLDSTLPLVADMKARNVTSLLFEIRFGDNYPMSPPFFRLVYPRFLPFLQGGGGHITAGGSICMDLLTTSGWSPAYTISPILLQIRTAVSSLEPRPARLDTGNWKMPYSMSEAVAGFKRAAATHNWVVPPELDVMTRSY